MSNSILGESIFSFELTLPNPLPPYILIEIAGPDTFNNVYNSVKTPIFWKLDVAVLSSIGFNHYRSK